MNNPVSVKSAYTEMSEVNSGLMGVFKFFFKLLLALVVVVAAGFSYLYYDAHRPVIINDDPLLVNDATGMNPIKVGSVIVPKTEHDIVEAIKLTSGPVSIGGARFSMGGQTSYPDSLHIDMRKYDRVVEFDKEGREVTVQAGMIWRDLQQFIDPHDLSIKIMQDFNNFTVGGALSVNAHGRYVHEGAIINSVKSFRIILADGQVYYASRDENPALFFAAIGGYGGIGVITHVTLELVDNYPIERRVEYVDFHKFLGYFRDNILFDESVELHNAILYPPHYEIMSDISWRRSGEALTNEARMRDHNEGNWLRLEFIDWIAQSNFLKKVRHRLIDPLIFEKDKVVMRNYETSYDIRDFGFVSHSDSTLAVREYFIPVENFEVFVLKMRDVFLRHDVDVLNITVRYTPLDRESLLSWAKDNVFSFLVVYRQGKDEGSQKQVASWSEELIQSAIDSEGSYYLPFQLHDSTEQFERAYPGAQAFFKLKKVADPENRFINHLWLKHYAENSAYRAALESKAVDTGQTTDRN